MHAAAEEIAGVEPAEKEIGVGDGRFGAALAVAGGTGRGAGALRTDPEETAGVDPGDAAATGADRFDVDQGDGGGHAPLDLVLGGVACSPSADHDRDVGAGAAHVEGEEVGFARLKSEGRRREHPTGRTGLGRLDRVVGGGLGAHRAAVRLHDRPGRA